MGSYVLPEAADRSTSFTYNYPLLRQKKDEDYATWLISEYFRYVEIATYSLSSGTVRKTVLHLHFEQDDHDGPALLVLSRLDARHLP